MASNLKSVGAFALTPHKVSVSILVQLYASPSSGPVPFPFSNIPQHNRLAIFLTSLTKSCDNFLEPQLDELVIQLKAASYELNEFLTEQLNNRLSSLISPDDLFNFFNGLRVVVGNADGGQVEDDQILLDPNSNLGMFVRRCVLAFNLLSFEGVCHLLTDIGAYCREFFSSCPTDPRLDLSIPKMMLGFDEEFKNESELSEDDKLELENDPFEREVHGFRGGTSSGKNSIFHTYAARSFFGQGGQHEASFIQDSVSSKFNHHMDGTEDGGFVFPFSDPSRINDLHGERFLRTNWQVQGYLAEQADLIERQTSLISMSVFESMLKQLQTLAPELHRVHYLRYLISLYHDDYTPALDNLHCYFDYSAGIEGIDTGSSSMLSDLFIGRYETALLCLGIMHSHFGHSKQAIEALTEAVRISQQNNDDSCLAYTLAAICDLLSNTGVPSTIGIIGSAYSPGTNTGLGGSLSTQQQLLVLLKRSLKRADSLKLTRLVAFNRLALAKFDLKHVKRPLVSFGPKAPTVLKTCPISVCKELRLTSYLLSEFCSDVGSQPIDGAFSTSWLKNLLKPGAPSILVDADVSGSLDAFYFGGQPSPIPGHVLQLAGESYLVKASAWELYGSAPLVRLNALVHATCFADGASSGDLSSAYAKLIQHLAVFKGYKEAFTALKLVEGKFSSVSKSRIKFLRLQLLHDYALHRGHIKLAQQICDEFGVLASSVAGVDMELKTEARLRHARTFLAANQFSQAAVVAHSLFCMCYKYSMQVENATVLLLLADIHKKSGNAVSGLPYALASLSFCQSFNLDLLEASATLTLTELWLSLGSNHAKRALTLLQRALPMILGHGGLELRARANIAVAKCYLSDPCFSVSDDPNTVLDPLKQASEELQILEYHELAAEAFYLMAITYNKLGQLEEREDAATSFKKHVNALENPQNQDEPFLYGLDS